ncbi:MAG TPA: helix-turn-helix domain-containing protein [Frankiaceae bacterium]|jgi:lambda repressor-like predicted transcriptional regulator|nr:helix-turn-helix domain-containing protein [Frankiaceae bacterium]
MPRSFPAEPARRALRALLADRQDSIVATAAAIGVDATTLHRLFTRDVIRYDAADRVAVALGHHPSELWPEWFAVAAGEDDVQ